VEGVAAKVVQALAGLEMALGDGQRVSHRFLEGHQGCLAVQVGAGD
jgi:hypothetical protein